MIFQIPSFTARLGWPLFGALVGYCSWRADLATDLAH